MSTQCKEHQALIGKSHKASLCKQVIDAVHDLAHPDSAKCE